MFELAHRSKNLLAIVDSLAGQTARTVTTLDDFSGRFRKRLRGLSASQELLLHQNWRGAPVSELVRNQLAAFAPEDAGRIVLSGPNVSVRAAAAEALGLALHELATNAVKYGALSVLAGKIHVTWTVDASHVDPRMFNISWIESGGPTVAPPTRKGFGNIVIERMVAASLDGTVSLKYPDTGVCWNLSAPVTSCIQNI